MKRKVVWLLVICLMVTALVVISCGPAATTTPPTTAPPTTAPPTTAPPTTSPKPAGEPQYGGTLTVLHVHSGTEPQTWEAYDHIWSLEVFTSPYLENLLSGDFEKYGPRGANKYSFTDLEYIPPEYLKGQLAESWEMPNPKTTVYHLRKGVMWPNKPGVMSAREFTADDVVFCLNRQLQKKFGFYFFAEPITVTARDKYTVVMEMKDQTTGWILPMGWCYYARIYPPEVVNAGMAKWQNAVGTGPFMLTNYVSGASLTYVKNPNYYGTTTIGGKEYKLPFVDRMEWLIIVDESTRLAAIRTGKVDMNELVSWKYRETLAESNPDLARYRFISTTGYSVALRVDKPDLPFKDIRVRRALSMAIDRQDIMKSLMGGNAVVLSYPFSMTWGEDFYTPVEKLPESTRELFEYNPQKAKQLLTEAGYPTGFKSEMVISSTGTYQTDLASMVIAYWEKNLNVKVDLKPNIYATYYSIMVGRSHKEMYMMSKGCGDPIVILYRIGGGGTPIQIWNSAAWDDPYFNAQYQKATVAPTSAEARKMLKDLQVYYIDQAAYIILPVEYWYSYAWPWVKNWYGELNANTRSPGLIHAQIWLDRDLREKMTGKR